MVNKYGKKAVTGTGGVWAASVEIDGGELGVVVLLLSRQHELRPKLLILHTTRHDTRAHTRHAQTANASASTPT